MQRTCGHEGGAEGRICVHLAQDEDLSFLSRFTGAGTEYWVVCSACGDVEAPPLVTVCESCVRDREQYVLSWGGLRGRPEVRVRASSLAFRQTEVQVPGLAGATSAAAAALVDGDRSAWLVVQDGALWRVDVEPDGGRMIRVCALAGQLEGEDLRIEVAPDGRFAAVVERRGQYGVVLEVASGAITMRLDRGRYHVSQYDFACVFAADGALVHATEWNRLDVSDPATGELLTPRTASEGAGGRPEHALDYFHAGLSVSPDGRWLVDDGWVWHPCGFLRRMDLQRWRHENPWETEDGPSLLDLRLVNYFWDAPRCFVDDRTLVVWGFGFDDEAMVDAALVFDVETGARLRWFAGPPRGRFVFDRHLIVVAAEGTSVWDVATGERLLAAPGLAPQAFHPVTREHATFAAGAVVLSRLVEE
ncbi:hypothetical protein [Nannocystis punicea]|uniref:Uncharacterized protein n=1 Tax=Nannocystis punicea TaxID=2995304 RepID=A0ABY7HK63_9BACT|nr:hypothetical protein [Nannocystis poenicansa]WAS99422.1 hypothetical protein O0S08_25120 [Nannocystis poenicansa]